MSIYLILCESSTFNNLISSIERELTWMDKENRIRRPQKFRCMVGTQQKTRSAIRSVGSSQRSASKRLRPCPSLSSYPFSLPFLYFLCILRQGLTVEPDIALISGSPAASVFWVLGWQAWATVPVWAALPCLLSRSSLPYKCSTHWNAC